MKALISMGFVALKKNLILSVLFGTVVCGFGIFNGKIYAVAPACAYLALFLTSTSYMIDCKVKFQQYLFSMPIKKKDYIFSKLFYAVIFGMIGAGLTFVYLFVENTIRFDLIILISLIILEAIILFPTIQLAFFIKFGAERGVFIMVIAYILFFVIITALKGNGNIFRGILQARELASAVTLGAGILFAGAILIWILVKISIRALEKKEY